MAEHNVLGHEGEDRAAQYLIAKGYTILDRNWRSGHKELDMVARKDNQLVVVEVKTRRGTKFGNPQDAVDRMKIRRLTAAADSYVRLNCIDLDVRFDIVTVVENGNCVTVEHIEDAFFPPLENFGR